MNPRFKHYTVNNHWFGIQFKPNGIVIKSISSASQLADIFTKDLRATLFKANILMSMGW